MQATPSEVRRENGKPLSDRDAGFSWTSAKLRSVVWQVLVVGLVLSGLCWFTVNTIHNLESRRIASGFGFLGSEAGLPIGEHLISYTPADTYLRALTAGVLNTLKVAVAGIAFASVLGTLIGISRLSRNWLLARVSAVYVEVVRNLPLLLQLLLIYTVLQGLPAPREAFSPFPGVFLSNRGLFFPSLVWSAPLLWTFAAAAAGVAVAILCARWATMRRLADGRPRPVWPLMFAVVAGAPVAVSVVTGADWIMTAPELRGFNFRGGANVSPEFFALLVGLVIYTSAFIAEIVRAGILAVGRGQWEAARALGLHNRAILQLIVLPQALRVIVPPVTSQYLNLAKNSSLAVAIGYQDIVSITNTVINQTGQAVEGIAIIMAVYLTISLTISLFMNWYNKRIALTER